MIRLEDYPDHKLIVIDNKVYDITGFDHPGGPVIENFISKDASGDNIIPRIIQDVFATFHGETTRDILANFYFGDIEGKKGNVFKENVIKLREKLIRENAFNSNKIYYFFKFSSTLLLLLISIALYLVYKRSGQSALFWGSALLLGVFWQQCGWLAHDFAHHQVFKDRKFNDWSALVIGNLFQGFSCAWWKDKHNLHHALPNVHGKDDDINTLPYLAWSIHALSGMSQEGVTKWFIKNQMYSFYGILLFARIQWLKSSIVFAVNHGLALEMLFIGIHWCMLAGWLSLMTFNEATLFFLLSECFSGFLLGSVFALNHNAMPVLTTNEIKEMDFFTLQVITGRDVKSSWFMDWFTGGLNYQIEHHLFPTLPRHQLGDISKEVRTLCEKSRIPYHCTGFLDGNVEVLRGLHDVAKNI